MPEVTVGQIFDTPIHEASVPVESQPVRLSEYLFTQLQRLPVQVLYECPLKDVRIDLTKNYPPMDYLLTRHGVGCIPRGDIQGLGGKMKNGKTTAGLCIVIALLKGEFMGFKSARNNYKCLIVDTEQSVINAVGKVKIIHRLVGWPENTNSQRLVSISLRNISPEKRLGYLEEAINIEQPDFVLLDGVADICTDFMDSAKSRETIDKLMKLSKTCAIMCVLHTNKKDEEFRGHLGTELMNKCSEAYVVCKTDDIAKVRQVVCRNEQLADWAFSIGEGGVPEGEVILSKADEKKDELSKVFAKIFGEKGEYCYTDLCKACMAEFKVKDRRAKDIMKEAVQQSIISKNYEGKYIFSDFPEITANDTEDDNIFS